MQLPDTPNIEAYLKDVMGCTRIGDGTLSTDMFAVHAGLRMTIRWRDKGPHEPMVIGSITW